MDFIITLAAGLVFLGLCAIALFFVWNIICLIIGLISKLYSPRNKAIALIALLISLYCWILVDINIFKWPSIGLGFVCFIYYAMSVANERLASSGYSSNNSYLPETQGASTNSSFSLSPLAWLGMGYLLFHDDNKVEAHHVHHDYSSSETNHDNDFDEAIPEDGYQSIDVCSMEDSTDIVDM